MKMQIHKFSRQITMFSFFISHFVFRRQPDDFFFLKKKIVKWKQVKITNMICITKTLDKDDLSFLVIYLPNNQITPII